MPDDARPRPLVADLVQPGDPWPPIEVYDEIASTNAVLVAEPRPWRVVVAERQTQGRGRLGRTWVTVPGRGLAVSALVPAAGMPLGWLPLTAGLALAEAIETTSGVAAVLKWPNDVQLPADAQRKAAGVLCEWTPLGVVVGVGVNISHRRAELPVPEASSLALAGGEVSRETLLTAYLRRLAGLVGTLAIDREAIRDRYADRCATLGAHVVVHGGEGVLQGRATGVDAEGRLILWTASGTVTVAAGDVVHVRPGGAQEEGTEHER